MFSLTLDFSRKNPQVFMISPHFRYALVFNSSMESRLLRAGITAIKCKSLPKETKVRFSKISRCENLNPKSAIPSPKPLGVCAVRLMCIAAMPVRSRRV